jgi:glycosyltransferase involved in cell wall biosynthesis
VRVLMDYRAALRERSGVGEYTHQLARALIATYARNGSDRPLDLTVFSSSWKDRFVPSAELAGATAIDRRVPVKLLNFAWHRLNWPPAEALTGRTFDVTHSLHPLLLPSKTAARVVTIHDLNFLAHPERTRAEVRRDYPSLARDHARRADAIVTVSEFTAREIVEKLGVPRSRITVCLPGAPDWIRRSEPPDGGYVLFLGTLEPRKNVAGLLDAWERVIDVIDRARAFKTSVPQLVVAGKATEESRSWLARLERPPLQGRVRHVGYVNPENRRELYEGARLLVQPSLEEGFGMPVLEAMTAGVPVVAADRGALPEVLGDAGLLVDPNRPDRIAGAIVQMLNDDAFAAACVSRGLTRSREFRWDRTARGVYTAYMKAIENRRCASA